MEMLQQWLLPLLLLLLMQPQYFASATVVHVTEGSTRPCRLEQLPVRVLTCSGSDVSAVPTVDAGLDVKIFYLDACPIGVLGADSFYNLTTSLTYLSIRSTVPITGLHGDAFRNLGLLTELIVVASANQASAVSTTGLLRTLSSLIFLHLENVKLGSLPSEFASGTKLVTVRLINADIVSLAPDAFVRLPSLSVLEIRNSPAASYVADLLRQIGTVEELTMISCGLVQVRAVATFNRLRRINMASNQLTQLDLRSLTGLGATLEELSLGSNQLGASGLPGLESMTALRRLYLTSNAELKQMPNNLGQLEGLELLDARLTSITNIRVGDFHERSRLASLKLDEAPLNFVEVTAFQRLSRLTELSLTLPTSPVLFRSVTDSQPASWLEMLVSLTALRNLTLRGFGPGVHSSLDDTVWPGLASCQQLRRLTLDHNSITSVPDFQFAASSGSQLELLSLAGNSIASISSASLYGLAPKAQLNLQDNNLGTLDNCSLARFTTLAGLGLSGNPWRCDCDLVWLLERLRSEATPEVLSSITCNQPSGLLGRTWSTLTASDFCPPGSATSGNVPCEVRIPPSTQSPTPTAFPFPLDIRLSLEPGHDQLLVRMLLNASGLASRFDRYTVRYGPDRAFDYSSRVQEALISVSSLTFHLDAVEMHRFCVILQGPDSTASAESPTNCRTFLPASPEPVITAAHISAAVIAPIGALALIGICAFCLVSRQRRRKDAKAAMAARQRQEEDYSYTYLDDPNKAGNPRFQASRKPESRRFTRRSGSNTLGGSRPSLTASSSNLQQQLQQIQQLQQMQQVQQMQQMQELQSGRRMNSMSQLGQQSDQFSAMRGARSTDHLSSTLGTSGGPLGGGSRARSQEFGIDRQQLQRSRSGGFSQYPALPTEEEAPPPLPARNPSRMMLTQPEDQETYEEMDS